MSQVPHVDPTAKQSLFKRATRATVRTRAGTWIARELVAPIEPKVIKASRGKIVIGFGFPTLNLTTRGRKSGKPRTATLVYFTQGDDVVLIASSFGRDAHPAWYLNLKADPHCELFSRGRGGRYVAREADPDERDRLFELARQVYAGYQNYAEKTDRRIPVMVLSPHEVLRPRPECAPGLIECRASCLRPRSNSSQSSRRFGPITAVDGLDLDVPEGICLGLLGPNGAGKSTTMRLLTGQAIADAGRAPGARPRAARRRRSAARAEMGVVPQLDNLDVDVTVEENLAVFARLYRVPDVARRRRPRARAGAPDRPPPRRRRRALRRHAPPPAAGPRPRPRTAAGPARRADRRPRPADPHRSSGR